MLLGSVWVFFDDLDVRLKLMSWALRVLKNAVMNHCLDVMEVLLTNWTFDWFCGIEHWSMIQMLLDCLFKVLNLVRFTDSGCLCFMSDLHWIHRPSSLFILAIHFVVHQCPFCFGNRRVLFKFSKISFKRTRVTSPRSRVRTLKCRKL